MSPEGGSLARDLLANERTLLAWVRTALTLLAAGLAAPTLLRGRAGGLGAVVGVALTVLAAATAIAGYRRWVRNDEELRDGGTPPDSTGAMRALVAAVVVVAVVAAVVVAVSA